MACYVEHLIHQNGTNFKTGKPQWAVDSKGSVGKIADAVAPTYPRRSLNGQTISKMLSLMLSLPHHLAK